MATENLKVKITADASQAKAEIGKFKDTLKGSIAAGDTMTESLGKVAAAATAVAVAAKAVKAVVQNALDVAATGDASKDNAQKVFMTTTAYQEWGYVLKQNGIEMSALKMGMRQFSQKVASGDAALRKYGITATDVSTAFEQAIYAIQNMSSETEKVAAATELFGTRALELMPILNMTNAETQSLMDTYRAIGATMSNELIAASDRCNDSITEMKAAWSGLRNILAAYVIPVITKVVQWVTIAIAYLRIFLKAMFGIKETYGGESKKGTIAGASASTNKSTGGTAKNLKKAAKHAKELKRTLMGIDELSRLAEKATSSAGAGGGGGGGISGGGIDIGDLGDFGAVFSEDALDKIEAFRQKIEGISDKLHGLYLIGSGIKDIIFFNYGDGFAKIKEGIELVFPSIKTLKDKWQEIKDKVKDIKAKATVEISDKFSSTWKKIKSGWQSIKNKTATIKLAFVDKLKSGYNAIASKIQSVRKKYPATRIILPDIHPLARGGVLTSPTTALMGEYAGARSNPEIATPQSLMYETMQKANGDLVSAFAVMTRQVISAIEQKDLSVQIGDEQIARSAQRGNTAYYNRTGKALLTI